MRGTKYGIDMAIAPTWLKPDQIERRRDVLRTVEQLLSTLGKSRGSVEQRFQYAAAVIARQAVREADDELRRASQAADDQGAAPVDAKTLDLVRTFNTIGPARLAGLLNGIYKVPNFDVRGVDIVHSEPSNSEIGDAKPE